MKKTKNSKRIGVKSIHYNNNNIYIQDSFSKDIKLLYDVEYNNINKLRTVKNIEKPDNLENIAQFENIENKKGFELTKTIHDKELKSKIETVKNISYLQSLKEITDTNNFEIQIYNNYEDIKKILGAYCNHVVYKLDSLVHARTRNISTFYFDLVGTAISSRDLTKVRNKYKEKYEEYLRKKAENSKSKPTSLNPQDFEKQLDELVSVLEGFGIKFNKKKTDATATFTDKKPNFGIFGGNLDVLHTLLGDDNAKDELTEDENDTDEILATDENKRLAYDYIRMLAYIRNFSMHSAVLDNKTSKLLEQVKKDILGYKEKFIKSNTKYIFALKDIYPNDYNIIQDYFEYTTFGEKKNLGLSTDKISKQVTAKLNLNSLHIDKTKMAEFLNKFKTILTFDIYRFFNNDTLKEKCIRELKECEKKEDKESLYEKYAEKYKLHQNSFIYTLQTKLPKYLGEYENENDSDVKIDFNIDEYIKNDFLNAIYLFSIFLNKKEANSMFAEIINKIDSINELLLLSKKTGAEINSKTFASFEKTIPLNSNFNVMLTQLQLLRNLRLRKLGATAKEKKSNIKTDEYKDMFNCFNSVAYTFDSFMNDLRKGEDGKEIKPFKGKNGKFVTPKIKKPLKNIFRNSVYDSKYYQYLSTYTNTAICKQIMSNKTIVKFVLCNILGVNPRNELIGKFNIDKEHEGMLKLLSTAYHGYRRDGITDKDKAYLITPNNVSELVEVLSTFTIDKLAASIFDNTKQDFNYLSILKLYFMVCYLVVKGVMRINSSYFIAIQDYESIYKILNPNINDNETKFNFEVVDNFIKKAPNKKSRSYNQLKVLLEKEYIANYRDNEEYLKLLKQYRNAVAHCALLSDEKVWKTDIKNITSYFSLYQTLMQTKLKGLYSKAWGNNFDEYFKLNDNKSYSTKLAIALNIPFAYNMSRFNNITIEKYATKKND